MIKKGFTFVTGPAQTTFTLGLKNNAPGGGGNDWAIDDISVATCTPVLACSLRRLYMPVMVMPSISLSRRCFSPNYVNWAWKEARTWCYLGQYRISGTGTPVAVAAPGST